MNGSCEILKRTQDLNVNNLIELPSKIKVIVWRISVRCVKFLMSLNRNTSISG